MAAKAGSLTIDLNANTSRLNSDFKKATSIVNKYKRNARKSFNKVSKAVMSTKGAVVGLAGVAGFGYLIKQSLSSADALAKTADKLGITTEGLAGLRHAADLSGVANGTFDKSLQNMVRTIRDANNGMKVSKDAYEGLGLSVESLAKMSPEQQFETVAEAINKVENNTTKLGAAYDIFGGKGTALINTLAMGKKGLSEASEEAKLLGLSITRIDAAKIEAANDAMTRASGVIKGAAQSVAVELSPYLEKAAVMFTNMAKESGGFGKIASNAFTSVINGVAMVSDVINGLRVVWQGVKVAVIGFAAASIASIDTVIGGAMKLASVLPGIDLSGPIEEMGAISEGVTQQFNDAKTKMHNMMMEKPPSNGIIEAFEDVKVASEEAGIAVAESKIKTGEMTTQIGIESMNNDANLMKLGEALKTLEVEKATNARIALAKKEKAAKIGIIGGMMGNLATLMNAKSKRLFKIGKVAAISSALINTYQAVTKTMTMLPYPWNIGMAVAQGVAGMVQVQKIKSQSFGGGGGGVSVGGGGGGGGSTPSLQPDDFLIPSDSSGSEAVSTGQTARIVIQGMGAHTEAARELLEVLIETKQDMGNIKEVVFS